MDSSGGAARGRIVGGTCMCGRSVPRDRRIDLLAPAQDPALEVPHAPEARLLELPDRLRAPAAALAVEDDVPRAVERAQGLGEPGEGREPGAVDPGDVPLV